jgi:hypothetical protein
MHLFCLHNRDNELLTNTEAIFTNVEPFDRLLLYLCAASVESKSSLSVALTPLKCS